MNENNDPIVQLRELSRQLGMALVRALQQDYKSVDELARNLRIIFPDGDPSVDAMEAIASSIEGQAEPFAYISQYSFDTMNKCRGDNYPGFVEAWSASDEERTIPLYTALANAA